MSEAWRGWTRERLSTNEFSANTWTTDYVGRTWRLRTATDRAGYELTDVADGSDFPTAFARSPDDARAIIEHYLRSGA